MCVCEGGREGGLRIDRDRNRRRERKASASNQARSTRSATLSKKIALIGWANGRKALPKCVMHTLFTQPYATK